MCFLRAKNRITRADLPRSLHSQLLIHPRRQSSELGFVDAAGEFAGEVGGEAFAVFRRGAG